MQEQEKQHRMLEGGFTLIELLIAIVVVGILTAVAIVGIGGLVNNGGTAACQASADAAKAASAVHFANTSTFPSTFDDMTTTSPKEYEIPSGVSIDATKKILNNGSNWTLTMTGGGANPAVFACT